MTSRSVATKWLRKQGFQDREPTFRNVENTARLEGFEPPTYGFVVGP